MSELQQIYNSLNAMSRDDSIAWLGKNYEYVCDLMGGGDEQSMFTIDAKGNTSTYKVDEGGNIKWCRSTLVDALIEMNKLNDL